MTKRQRRSAEILARQVRMLPHLRHLDSFRRQPIRTVAPSLPISDDAVTAWIGDHPQRQRLDPVLARCLAYLDTFNTRLNKGD